MRADAPTGSEIARMAKDIRFDSRKDIRTEQNGKKIHFRGADLSHVKSLAELESGQVVGMLETELAGDETTLPPGTHNMFISKVDGTWRVHAESGGRIVAEAAHVSVTEQTISSRKELRPGFSPKGWCLIDFCLIELWGVCLFQLQAFCF